jgi:hypothetical protein
MLKIIHLQFANLLQVNLVESGAIIDKWTIRLRPLIVELFFRNGCSVVCAQREFGTALGVRRTPTDKAIGRW